MLTFRSLLELVADEEALAAKSGDHPRRREVEGGDLLESDPFGLPLLIAGEPDLQLA
jgi:hypothetical protein